jgi:hypothetical protein
MKDDSIRTICFDMESANDLDAAAKLLEQCRLQLEECKAVAIKRKNERMLSDIEAATYALRDATDCFYSIFRDVAVAIMEGLQSRLSVSTAPA